jgi:hypothetical protein
MMKKTTAASSPDAYVAALPGWPRVTVEQLRTTVLGSAKFEETIKWGYLVYLSNPVLLIRAEESRVHRLLAGGNACAR